MGKRDEEPEEPGEEGTLSTTAEPGLAAEPELAEAQGRAADRVADRYCMYVVECADGTWYTGYATDVAHRVATHNAGRGAKYTRSRLPVTLVASAGFATRHEALSAEYHFKRLSRAQKEALVARAADEEGQLERLLAETFDLGACDTKGSHR